MTRTILTCILIVSTALAAAQPQSIEILEERLKHDISAKERVDIYADLAYNYVWSDAGHAHELSKKGIHLADSINYDLGRAKCLSEAGLSILYQGHGPESLEYLFEAIEILEDQEDAFWIFTTLSSIGYVYWELSEHDSAIGYFKQAEPYAESLGIDNFRISILSDIGETYIQLMKVDSGKKYVKASYDLAIVSQDTFQLGVTSNQLGVLYRLSNDLNLALKFSRFSVSHSIASNWNPRRSYLNMAEVFHLKEKFDSCIFYANESIAMAKAGSFLNEDVLRGYTLLADAYGKAGLQDSMITSLRRQIETSSLIVSKEKTKRIQGIVFDRQMNQAKVDQARKEAEMNANLKRQQIIALTGFSLALVILVFGSILVNRFRVIRKQKKIIQKEKERSDVLLLNILPLEIAEELKEKGKATARDFERVSILFTDFKGFTRASEELSAADLVAEIDTCFKAFDEIAEKFNIEKIKTIGDSYMAAGGVPVPEDDSVKNTVLAAIAMHEFISQRKEQLDANGLPSFEMRVGVHTGPVVAGIVGVKKFQYDIWGDTVNTASRIESSGQAGHVNISQSTYEFLKDDPQLSFQSRGKIQAKGKGEIEMYFVTKVKMKKETAYSKT